MNALCPDFGKALLLTGRSGGDPLRDGPGARHFMGLEEQVRRPPRSPNRSQGKWIQSIRPEPSGGYKVSIFVFKLSHFFIVIRCYF